jgi:hypothetical protein
MALQRPPIAVAAQPRSNVGQFLSGAVPHDEARSRFFDGPRRREAAGAVGHGAITQHWRGVRRAGRVQHRQEFHKTDGVAGMARRSLVGAFRFDRAYPLRLLTRRHKRIGLSTGAFVLVEAGFEAFE